MSRLGLLHKLAAVIKADTSLLSDVVMRLLSSSYLILSYLKLSSNSPSLGYKKGVNYVSHVNNLKCSDSLPSNFPFD